jgi:hypothetical protein
MFYPSLNDLFSAYFIKYVFRKGRLAKEKSHQKSLIHLLSTLPKVSAPAGYAQIEFND